MGRTVRILGIDPGLRKTGWGVVDVEGSRLSYVACGVVPSTGDLSLAERLREIHEGVLAVLAAHSPDEVAVEQTFVNKDALAAIKLGHARGVAMLCASLAGIEVSEYMPNLVKKTIVGAGHAEKAQIHAMVRVLLPKANPRTNDAADALAVALTHAQHRGARRMQALLAATI